MRQIWTPRRELQAVTLPVKMCRVLVDELTYKISKATFWSVSQTRLQYINNESNRFQTYVANRVAEIREARSVNTADVKTLKPQKLSCQHQRWRGPDFLWGAEGLLARCSN